MNTDLFLSLMNAFDDAEIENTMDLTTKEGNDNAVKAIEELNDTPIFDIFLGEGWKSQLIDMVKSCYKEEKKELPDYIDIIDPKVKDNIQGLVDTYLNDVVKVRVPNATAEQLESLGNALDDFGAWMYQKK